MSFDEDIFQFNEEFDVPQSPIQSPIEEDVEYNYSYTPSPYGNSNYESPTTFLYECIICNTSSNVPCEHVSGEDDFQLNNQVIMLNYRKWQNIAISH